eukprot:Filipodium_phascolosomae@DN806_c0_g1_i2.p1
MKSLVYGGRRGSQHKRGLLRVVQKERNCWSQPQESLLREAQHEAALLPSCNHQTPISPRQKASTLLHALLRNAEDQDLQMWHSLESLLEGRRQVCQEFPLVPDEC